MELSSTILFVQYAFHPGGVTEQVGKLFQLSFEPKIRLVRVCSVSATSCLQARDCTVVYLYISQVTFAVVLLRLRQCNSLGQKHRHRERRYHGHAVLRVFKFVPG